MVGVIAAAVAVSIISARQRNEHDTPTTPREKRDLVALHTRKTLRNLGLFKTGVTVPTYHEVTQELGRRGGWGYRATQDRLHFIAACFGCGSEPQVFESPGLRRTYIREHHQETGHIISRWEQPYSPDLDQND